MPSAPVSRKCFSLRTALVSMLLAGASTAASAAEWGNPGIHAAYGRDPSHNINKYELAINFDTPLQYGNPDGWLFKVQGEVNVAQWISRGGTNSQNLTEFGISPILRVEKRGGYFVPFVEGSVGLRVLSHTHTSDEHNMGSAFQFSDMLGVGVGFGKNQMTEVGFRFQHISNAGIKEPNPGSNFYTGYVRYRF